MSDPVTNPPVSPRPAAASGGMGRFVPALRSRWWTAVLGLSLMANLLVGGLVLGHNFRPGGHERIQGIGAIQLVPRGFFAQLPRERRLELQRMVRGKVRELRGLRDGSAESIMKLAALLEQDTYDPAQVMAAVNALATGPASLAARGETIVIEFISQLTPAERKLLAAAMRDRAARARPERD